MQGIIVFVVFGLIILAIIILVVINFTYKNLRQIREAYIERKETNQRLKEQKDKNPFGDDYFKSSDKGSQRKSQNQYEFQQKQGPKVQQQQRKPEESKETTARKTTTNSGVTIIDDRGEAGKKIFDHNDGEYVEFTEVNSEE